MLKTIGEYIIFKIYLKKSVGGLIVQKESKMTDKFYIDKAEVYQAGEKVTSVKPGQEVVLSGRPMYPLDIKAYMDDKSKDEEIIYSKGKEEDIVAVIE